MKKSILLLFAGAIAITAGAQQRQADNNVHVKKYINISEYQKMMAARSHVNIGSAADRTTSGPGGVRWYDYGNALNAWQVTWNSATTSSFAQPISPWVDSNSYLTFPTAPTKSYVSMATIGDVLSPQDTLFNDYHSYLGFGDIKVTNSNAYTVDSFALLGIYGHAYAFPANAGSVDTIRMTFTYGATSGSGGILGGGLAADPSSAYDGIMFPTLPYDSITNISQPTYTSPASNIQDIILDNRASGSLGIYSPNGTPTPQQIAPAGTPAYYDTTDGTSPLGPDILGSGGGIVLKMNTPLIVPAGDIVGVSLTFFSGMPSPPTLTGAGIGGLQLAAIDASNNENFNYNDFQPIVDFASDGGSPPVAQFVPFSALYPSPAISNNPYVGTSLSNNNTGCFKKFPNSENGWTNTYLPNWAWYIPSGASEEASQNQYPFIDLHIACPTCDTVKAPPPPVHNAGVNNVNSNNTVNAYPNPTNGTLNIAFNLAQASAVSVTLTNMVGEVVATQNMGTVATGKAVINTANLPEGMYIYTLTANGVRSSTGHVAIAH